MLLEHYTLQRLKSTKLSFIVILGDQPLPVFVIHVFTCNTRIYVMSSAIKCCVVVMLFPGQAKMVRDTGS